MTSLMRAVSDRLSRLRLRLVSFFHPVDQSTLLAVQAIRHQQDLIRLELMALEAEIMERSVR